MFLALQEMWSKVEEMSCFPTKCPVLHAGEYYHFLNDNGALWIWGALECRAIGLNIFVLLCYLLEGKRKEGTNSVTVVRCVKVLAEWKVILEHWWNLCYFHQNVRFMGCMEGFCGHYLTWMMLGLNTFFSSTKHLVQGQCSALKSHIAVCKPCCWD